MIIVIFQYLTIDKNIVKVHLYKIIKKVILYIINKVLPKNWIITETK